LEGQGGEGGCGKGGTVSVGVRKGLRGSGRFSLGNLRKETKLEGKGGGVRGSSLGEEVGRI